MKQKTLINMECDTVLTLQLEASLSKGEAEQAIRDGFYMEEFQQENTESPTASIKKPQYFKTQEVIKGKTILDRFPKHTKGQEHGQNTHNHNSKSDSKS